MGYELTWDRIALSSNALVVPHRREVNEVVGLIAAGDYLDAIDGQQSPTKSQSGRVRRD
jgi:hypothetical protein